MRMDNSIDKNSYLSDANRKDWIEAFYGKEIDALYGYKKESSWKRAKDPVKKASGWLKEQAKEEK